MNEIHLEEKELARLAKKASEVDSLLLSAFGDAPSLKSENLALELIAAVLSQNTSRANYEHAFERLVERFGNAKTIANAPLTEIEKAIRPGGLSKKKSKTIKEILAAIFEKSGDYSLEFLREMGVSEARKFLTSLPGVGPKTASVVLMFGDGRGVLPVDTHVLRTSTRIGLVPEGTSAEMAEPLLEQLVPPKARPRMHLNLVRLGREICHARNPKHGACPVKSTCDFFRHQVHGSVLAI
ncbi:MAG: endonuclease III [Actinomycetota bacterium]|nr:endonuclease III [Actinomycetota bacterium]